MKTKFTVIFLIFVQVVGISAKKSEKDIVFREPFTLKLHVDKEHYYEQVFDRIPYVYENSVYLFAGEEFGVNITLKDGEIVEVDYQEDLSRADLEFKFSQKLDDDGSAMMLLAIKNKTDFPIFMDGLITVPGEEKIFSTTIMPVQPGLSGFESWPHPIVQIVLQNIRVCE